MFLSGNGYYGTVQIGKANIMFIIRKKKHLQNFVMYYHTDQNNLDKYNIQYIAAASDCMINFS